MQNAFKEMKEVKKKKKVSAEGVTFSHQAALEWPI